MKEKFVCGLCRRELPIAERMKGQSRCKDRVACLEAQSAWIGSWDLPWVSRLP